MTITNDKYSMTDDTQVPHPNRFKLTFGRCTSCGVTTNTNHDECEMCAAPYDTLTEMASKCYYCGTMMTATWASAGPITSADLVYMLCKPCVDTPPVTEMTSKSGPCEARITPGTDETCGKPGVQEEEFSYPLCEEHAEIAYKCMAIDQDMLNNAY